MPQVAARGLTIGRATVVPVRKPSVAESPSARRIRRAYQVGRVGVFAIPLLAIVAALGLRSSHAFSTNRAEYADFVAHRWTTPMSIAITTATGVFAVISLISLALLLLGTRGRWLGIAGSILGLAGAVMMMIEVGAVVIRAQGVAKQVLGGHLDRAVITAAAHGTKAAVLVFGGAALLTLGWILLGLAIMITIGLNKGDGGLLIVAAPLVFLGGFFLHTLPTMGAFLLGAAGLGILFTAGRIAPDRVHEIRVGRVPAPAPMSAFARFTDEDLEAFYRGEETSLDDEAEPYEAVTSPAARESADAETAPATAGAVVATAAAATTAPKTARPARERGLGRLSRGIATAWQVRRPESPAGTTNGAAPSSVKTSSNSAVASNGKTSSNRTASSNGGASPNGKSPEVVAASSRNSSQSDAGQANESASKNGVVSRNASEPKNGSPAGRDGAVQPAKKSFSFGSWSPFRGGDKPPAANGSSGSSNGAATSASSKNGASKNGKPSSGSGAPASAPASGTPKHEASKRDALKHEASRRDAAKNDAGKRDSGKSGSAKSGPPKNDSVKTGGGKNAAAHARKKFSTSASVIATPSSSANASPNESGNKANTTPPTNADKAGNRGTTAGEASSENGASAKPDRQ